MNISSVIVYPRPGEAGGVRVRLAELSGVEVHAVGDDGRMIVTIEADGDAATVGLFDAISATEGVSAASMVYHQKESDPEMEISVGA